MNKPNHWLRAPLISLSQKAVEKKALKNYTGIFFKSMRYKQMHAFFIPETSN